MFRFHLNTVIYLIILFRLKPWMDCYSSQWLSHQWANSGKPEIKRPEWDKLVEKVGILTEETVCR